MNIAREIEKALQGYAKTLKRASLMARLLELANSTDKGAEEEQIIGHLLRAIWLAAEQDRVNELDELVTPVVESWYNT